MNERNSGPRFGVPVSEAFETLESRHLMSGPTLGEVQFGSGYPTAYQPTRISVDATDDAGVRAATFFMDRNANGRWDPFVDQPLGDDFTRDDDGRFSVTATPDGTWPAYPNYARIVADAVNDNGEWATLRPSRTMVVVGLPVVSSFYARVTAYVEGQPQPFLSIELYAKLDEPFVYPYGGTSATFFLDRNFNGTWDTGIDTDLGAANSLYGVYQFRSASLSGTTLNGQLMAVPFRSLSAPGERFGAPASATVIQPGFPSNVSVPLITRAITYNATNPNEDGFVIGQRIRLEFVASTPDTFRDVATLRAATLFYDANFDQRWTPGVDIDLGAHFFGPDVLTGIGRIEFTVTPQMGFDARPFVLTSVTTAGAWGPTYTVWARIISPPWIESAAPAAPSFSAAGSVSLDVQSRDDGPSRELFAWVDRNNDGVFQIGEGFEQGGLRLGFDPQNFRTQNWRVTISLSGLQYTPGTYRVGIIARDYQGLQSTARFFSITLE